MWASPTPLNIAWSDLKQTERAFHHAHADRYGHDLALPLELVNLRIAVTGPVPAIKLREAAGVRLPKTVVRIAMSPIVPLR